MPRSLAEIIKHAEELAARYESMGEGQSHVEAVAELREAVVAGAEAEKRIAAAVIAARADGLSWTAVGSVLGISGQAAQQRYGRGLSKPLDPLGRPTRVGPRPRTAAGAARPRSSKS